MKRPLSRIFVPLTTSALVLGGLSGGAHADPDPSTGVELNVPTSQFVGVPTTFNPSDAETVGLEALKQLRGSMWDRNVPFEGTTLQQAAAAKGINSRDAYINNTFIDGGYTRIALTRAIEEYPLTNSAIDAPHERPTNDTCQLTDCTPFITATIDGKVWYGGEVLAGGPDLRTAILTLWGENELPALKATSGRFSTGVDGTPTNGHLHNLINPSFRYFGFADITVNGSRIQVGEVSTMAYVPGTMNNATVSGTLYRSAKDGETATGVNGTPVPVLSTPGDTASAPDTNNPGTGTTQPDNPGAGLPGAQTPQPASSLINFGDSTNNGSNSTTAISVFNIISIMISIASVLGMIWTYFGPR